MKLYNVIMRRMDGPVLDPKGVMAADIVAAIAKAQAAVVDGAGRVVPTEVMSASFVGVVDVS